MQKQTRICLKKGKERPILQHHHWIYSGAVAGAVEKGTFAEVFSHEGELLGTAMLNPGGNSIVAHMLSFGSSKVEETLKQRIAEACAIRAKLFDPTQTNAIRLINAEGDGIPGLVVDSYHNVLVVQISHPALEAIKPLLIDLLREFANPRAIYEKSTSFMRKKEGLEEVRAHLFGEEIVEVEVLENGLKFVVNLLEGQKTGLFLDQREMRQLIGQLSRGKKVLNCFAYTGGFSSFALKGGAKHVDSVEISKRCEPFVTRNLNLNDLALERHRFLAEDAIDFIAKSPLDYDLVILDPPAFVKHRAAIDQAFRAYKDLNKTAIQKMPKNSLLLTCSCSYHVSDELFQNILFRASLESGRNVRIVGKHIQAHDHPISIYHPESSYLKSLLLLIE